MKPSGWIFLVVCWSLLSACTAWCYYKILNAPFGGGGKKD